LKKKAFSIKNTVFLILVLVSCHEKTQNDPSLTPEEYRQLGLPSHLIIWDIDDYNTAIPILDDLRVIQPLSLPKEESSKSGEYFKRIIDPENLSFILDESIPLKDRAFRIQEFVDIQANLITIYTDLDVNKQFYDQELIELYMFAILVTQSMLDLGQQINESVEEEDLEMQYAFGSIQDVYIRTLLFVLDNQRKSRFFREEDLEKLTEYISGSIQLNRGWLMPEVIEEIKMRLQNIIDKTSSERIKNKYTELMRLL
jgi:hypothetical protein